PPPPDGGVWRRELPKGGEAHLDQHHDYPQAKNCEKDRDDFDLSTRGCRKAHRKESHVPDSKDLKRAPKCQKRLRGVKGVQEEPNTSRCRVLRINDKVFGVPEHIHGQSNQV